MSYRRITHKTAGSVPEAKYEMREVPAREDRLARLRAEQEQRRLEEQSRQQEVLRLWGWKGAEQIQAWEEEARFPEKTKIEEMMHHIDRLRYTKALEKEYESKQASIKRMKASTSFYEKIGYPEYVGYEPFSIPKGYEVKAITETPSGLEISFQRITPSLTEAIVDFFAQKFPTEDKKLSDAQLAFNVKISELGGVAAEFVGGIETLVYTGAQLLQPLTGYEWKTRPPPAPFTEDVLSTVSGLITTGKLDTGKLETWTFPRVVGSVAGEAALSIVIMSGASFVGSKALAGTKIVASKISSPLKIGAKTVGSKFYQYVGEPTLKSVMGADYYMYVKSVGLPTFRHVSLPMKTAALKSYISGGLSYYVKEPIQIGLKGAFGTERYLFLKSVVAPNILHIGQFLPSLPLVSLPFRKPLPLSMLKSVYLPNITHPLKVLAPTLSYIKARYIPSIPQFTLQAPTFLKEPLMLARTVYQPNIAQLQKVWKPTLSLSYEKYVGIYPSISDLPPQIEGFIEALKLLPHEKPMWYLELKASTKTSVGKLHYSISQFQMPTSSLPKPQLYVETKSFGKAMMGKVRYTLKMPTPTVSYKTMKPFGAIITQTTKTSGKTFTLTTQAIKETTKITRLSGVPALSQVAVVLPKVSTTTRKKETKAYPILYSAEFPKIYGKEITAPKLKPFPTIKEATIPKTVPKSLLKTSELLGLELLGKQALSQTSLSSQLETQLLKQTQIQRQLQKQLQMQPLRYRLDQKQEEKRKKRGKGLFGEWFLREHKIATPKQVAATFGFSMPKSKKRKKKRRR